MEKKILIIDIETTGFSHSKNKIVEVGIVELNLTTGNKRIIFDQVCKESELTPEEIGEAWVIQNSTLTAEEVLNSSNFSDIKSEIQNIIDIYPLGATAFNNAFDFGFLENRGIKFPKKLSCPMKLSTDICKIPNVRGGYKWPKVEEAHFHFCGDVGYIEQHRGADDAFYEADIVLELYKLGVFTLN